MPVVISVPHSGSRSLLRHLQLLRIGPEEGPEHIYHFGEHDEDIASYAGAVHIPLRNPVDVMLSWMSRNKPLRGLFAAMERMAEYDNPNVTLHRAEELPIRMGGGTGAGQFLDRATLSRVLAHHVSSRVLEFYQTHGGY